MTQESLDRTGASGGAFWSYAAGFILAYILTVLSFALVLSAHFSRKAILAGIFCAAVVQMFVHLHFFLHLGTSSESRWNVLALCFAFILLALFVGGSVWIMYNLHYRMM